MFFGRRVYQRIVGDLFTITSKGRITKIVCDRELLEEMDRKHEVEKAKAEQDRYAKSVKGMKKELEDLRKEQEKGAKEESNTQWLARRMRERSREMTDEQRDVMQKVGIGLGINSPAARFPSIVS
ncbi:hypothetical protein ADUPG1_003866, partial [Aduncisulcus paluster]